MSYNHSKHAGNQGDVLKHAVLVEVVKHLVVKKADGASSLNFPFHYLETHCGAPMHELTGSSEYLEGIGKFWDKDDPFKGLDYFRYVSKTQLTTARYPSSWLLAYQTLMDAQCYNHTLTLFDTSADVAKAVKSSPYMTDRINFHCIDATKNIGKHLKQVDFVFIDPSYSLKKGEVSSSDWGMVIKLAQALTKKGIPFLVWYPYFTEKTPMKLVKETGLLSLELLNPKITQEGEMKGSGMLLGGLEEGFVVSLSNALDEPLSELGELTIRN